MSTQIRRFEIQLEHDIDEQYQYEPGELLKGTVNLNLTDLIKVKNVQVQIKGEATVSWEDEATRTFSANETYIDIVQELLPPVAEDDSVTLEAGEHNYPLEYQLPLNLPSSFIGKFGSITYVVKATLREDKRFGLSTMITSEPFLVLRKLDISQDPALQTKVELEDTMRIWGGIMFCISGKVHATLSVDRTGHLPGEDIFMNAQIMNESSRTVKALQASLIMHSTFHAKNKSRRNTQIVNKKRDQWEMAYGDGRRWKNVRLTIPPYIPESRLDGCDIIDITYELQFRVEIKGDNEITMSMPITVGTMQDDGVAQESANHFRASTLIMGGKQMDPSVLDGTDPNSGDVEVEIDEEEHDKFRHPMAPGTTRNNPIFMNFKESSNL